MKHLKVFNTLQEYNQYKQAGNIDYPLTSYIENTRETKFDHWIPNGTIMYFDDYDIEQTSTWGDISTPSKLKAALTKNLEKQDKYEFISEFIYNGRYLWLWYCITDDDNLLPYLLTPAFNNFNDFYRHTIMYDPGQKYSPKYAELDEDMNPWYETENPEYYSFDSTNKVLAYVKNDSYTPPTPETNFEGTMIGMQNSMEYEYGTDDPFWTDSYDTLYTYADTIDYNGKKYFLWEYEDGDDGGTVTDGGYPNAKYYMLTNTYETPEDLYYMSCSYDYRNQNGIGVYQLSEDMEWDYKGMEGVLSVVYLP